MYLYSNILGTFVFSQNFEIRERVLFKNSEIQKIYSMLEKGEILESEKDFSDKFKSIINLRKTKDPKALDKVMKILSEHKQDFYEKNLFLTRQQIKESVTPDLLIIQVSSSIEELNKSTNLLVKRLREWYSYVLPEVEEKITDHKHFAELILKNSRKEQIKDFDISNSMGLELDKKDADSILSLAQKVLSLIEEREEMEKYLLSLMKKTCPNITEVAGYLIGAKLISIAGSLKHIVMMPSSTIQLLGAEKALFRHMINKSAKPPKHGIIHEHTLLQRVKREEKGKAARALADKISLAAKVDYFHGKFIGDELRKELEDKFK